MNADIRLLFLWRTRLPEPLQLFKDDKTSRDKFVDEIIKEAVDIHGFVGS
jgi:hypothetical protein